MNNHLQPVFDTLLPGLVEAKIDCFVYGGISVAACAGNFIRFNKDVDTFVRYSDFKRSHQILTVLCRQRDFQIFYIKPKEIDGRPKIKIKVAGVERMSVIPVYEKDNFVEFKYTDDSDEQYPSQILEKVERNLAGFRFFTPKDEFIKEKFMNHIKSRPEKMQRKEYKIDAKALNIL